MESTPLPSSPVSPAGSALTHPWDFLTLNSHLDLPVSPLTSTQVCQTPLLRALLNKGGLDLASQLPWPFPSVAELSSLIANTVTDCVTCKAFCSHSFGTRALLFLQDLQVWVSAHQQGAGSWAEGR